jgi:acetyl-CoA synthetase
LLINIVIIFEENNVSMKIKSTEQYNSEKVQFDNDPERFWEKKAESFMWKKKWDEVLNWDFHSAKINWFNGGKLNIIKKEEISLL